MIGKWLRASLAVLVVSTSMVAASGSGKAQSINPDDADPVWVAGAVAYCNTLAATKPWAVAFDPTCQRLVVMGLWSAGKFIFPDQAS